MRQMDKKAYSWIRGAGEAVTHNVFDGDVREDEAATTTEEALNKVAAYWKRIWHRDADNDEEAFEKWQAAMMDIGKEAYEKLDWEPLQPDELQTVAKGNRGAAAGMSGWTGRELADWPTGAWKTAASMLNDFIEVPEVWGEFRQVLLRKADANKHKHKDGATEVKDLRPMSIECGVLRTVATAIAKRSSTREWTRRWATKSMAGGIPGRGVGDGVLGLDLALSKTKGVLVSLDLAKAFDYCMPSLAIKCMVKLGMNQQVAGLCRHVWMNQKRYLQIDTDMKTTLVRVCASLPQGDAFSPMALNAIMVAPTAAIEHRMNDAEVMATYLDDRSFVTETAAKAKELTTEWQKWGDSLGLKETSRRPRSS